MTKILAIETSCDETACAVVEDGSRILSNVVSSQINVHTLYGGVVPEVASRIHVENISAVIEEAVKRSGCTMDDIDAVAFTQGPGLIGSLHVGVQAAKTLAWEFDKPLIPVNHMTGHIYANRFAIDHDLRFPLLALVISGGHTQLVWMKDDWSFEIIGTTVDDAIGEAYDKVSRVLGTGYPGGPVIDKMAKLGKPHYKLPTPKVDGKYDFSFSGLKTAVSQMIAREEKAGNEIIKEDVAYAFQETALNSMVGKTIQAVKDLHPVMVITAGGVAANSRLRVLLAEEMKQFPDIELSQPPIRFCTDNASMIGASGYVAYRHGLFGTLDVSADPSLPMPGEI
ncbi:MAG: tRNA (adenosine(37)-N6)-threonylcarbamoyltransferase complex transferase subunit TsaD [Bulleidia sp.]|nr:tRNA (adenosine(37)-N6)-threonylcarbamoyltransferase complex transferase subunit TsaD [Bulleidia sp.]